MLAVVVLITVHAKALPNAIGADPVIISIKAITGLQFDQVRFTVKPGATVKIVLTNSDDMSHNLLITQPGAREAVVDAALKLGDQGPKVGYVPDMPEVLWSIPLLDPGENQSITFTAPTKEGVYPYVCTYPGHGFVMFGAMYVTNNDKMPPLKDDLNIPSVRRNEGQGGNGGHAGHTGPAHPYEETPPFLYRTFIEDAGPAAIAVRLTDNLSYCWDAGSCRLRYAWQGDFLDMSVLWRGHKQAVAKVLGTVFYRDKSEYPLRVGRPGMIPDVQFKGYRLVERYPEFHYLINGIEVYELIKPNADGTGLLRTFRIPDANQSIWFVSGSDDGITYTSSTGNWTGNAVKIDPADAKQFTITMTKKEGGLL